MAASPRKKFSLQSEVAVALRKYTLMKTDGWTLQFDRSLVSSILRAYRDKYLYVSGAVEDHFLPIYSRQELLQYLKILPAPEHKVAVPNQKRLKQIPLFTLKHLPNSTNGAETTTVKVPIEDLESIYKWAENHHKRVETHHPDGVGWRSGHMATIECVFDVFNSLLRTNTLANAYNKLFNVLLDSKFDNLNLQSIFYAFLHISIRGVANAEHIYQSANWRRENITQDLLLKVTRDFANGMQPRSLISAYVKETRLHAQCIEAELARLRSSIHRHDFTKFEPRMIYAYAWYWGVFQRYSETNKNRYRAGMYDPVPVVQGRPTMYTMGSSFGTGLAESAAVKEIITLIRDLPKEVGEVVGISLGEATQKIDQSLSNQQHILHSNAQHLINENAKAHEQVGTKLLDQIVEKSKTVGDSMMQSFEPAIEALKSFTGVIDSMMQKVINFFSPVPGFIHLNLSGKTIFDALSYYIMLINTESTVLKTILVILILNSFGLLKSAFSEILRFWSWIQASYEDDEGNVGTVGETSGLFEWLCESPLAIITTISGVLSSMVKGIPLSAKEFMSLSKKLADNLKNFHFISQGIAGITKLFDYCKKAYHTVMEWIGEHIFGRTPERIELAHKVSSLSTRVKYLHTESGLNAIRMSENVRQEAETILPEYLSLQAECRSKPEFRHLFNDLEKINRQVKEVSDFVTRLRAISNFQPTMFHIQFVGKPGIGKSTITKNVVSDISRTLWPDEPKASFYSYNTDLEYFDGYAGQKIMIVDDLYKINDPKHLTASMFLVTNTPVILPMANLNDKGVQLTSEIMISSTNTAYPIGKDVLCMEAVHRRRHMLVEVQCDPAVLDPSLGQFSMALFKKKYGEADPQTFPHLTFNLLRPVPKEFGGAASFGVGENEFDIYRSYAEDLKKANFKIAIGGDELDPTYYFSDENKPPPGITLPAYGWTYKQFISNCAVRFRSFRGSEGTYSAQRKFAHVENCLAEIDLLINQQEDLPGESALPMRKMMEQLLCKAQHPYGSEDEIGKRLYERSGNSLAPELDDINLKKIVDDILHESNPTSDGISLAEEQIRTQNILRRRNRTIADPIERDRLRIEEKEGKKVIRLTRFYTGWHEPPSVNATKIHEHFITMLQSHEGYLGKVKLDFGGIDNPSLKYVLWKLATVGIPQQVRNANVFLKWAASHELYYPNSDDFPESVRGTSTGFPITFFKDMIKIDGQWYLDTTNIGWKDGLGPVKVPLVPYSDGPIYQVEGDLALMLSCLPAFRTFVAEFDALTTAQQDALIQEARWRNAYLGSYTYEKVAYDCKNIFAKLGMSTLSYITSPFRYIAENYPFVTTIVAYFVTYFSVIFLLQKISELFQPRPTSKFLHKSQLASTIHFGRPTSSTAVGQLVESLAERNVQQVLINDTFSGQKAQALFTGQYVILNSHVLRNIKDSEFVLTIIGKENKVTRHIIPKTNVYSDPCGDLAIIYSPSLPSARKIDKHFYSEEEYNNHKLEAELLFLSKSKQGILIDRHSALSRNRELKLKHNDYTGYITNALLVDGHTVAGLSGSTVVSLVQNRPRIIGIQAWETDIYTSPKIAVQVITLERYENLVAKLGDKLGIKVPERIEEPDILEVDGNITSAFSSVPKEQLVQRDVHHVGCVGKSQIKASIVRNFLKEQGIESESVPAALSPLDKRLYHQTAIHPLEHSLGKYFRGEILPFSSNLMARVKSGLKSHICSHLDKQNFRIISFEEAVTGIREDGSNPMNLSTSPGIPFIFDKIKKGKRDYLEISEEGDLVYIDHAFRQQYEQFISHLKNAEIPYNRAYDFPKDELRPKLKALGSEDNPPKTRTVTCMNVNYIIAWRQFTLDFWAAMHRAANGNFTFCPGINPEGPEWNNLYHYLNTHPNAVDFDVSNWDGYLRADLFQHAIDLVKSIIGDKDEHLVNVLNSIAFDVMNSYIQFDDIIYQKHRGMVSGFPGTAEMNTLAHWLLITYIYLILTLDTPYNNLISMFHHTAIAIYGDDIIITFSDEIKPYFNGKTIMSGYQEIGYPVTAASKSSNVEESRSLKECTFLKSSWRELIPSYYVRKMDQSVINNLVCWTRSKQDPIKQFYENYMDALRLAFSNGQECFYSFRDSVNLALLKAKQDIIVFDYVDFERDYFKRYLPELVNQHILYI